MFGAVALFSVCGALVAAVHVSGMSAVSLTSLGAGGALLAYTLVSGADRSQVPAGTLALLTALNLAQIGLYYLALKLAPTGPAAALHLCAPVILLVRELATGRRRLGARELATITLLAAGAAGAAITSPAGDGASSPLLGLVLALGSSVAFAAMISLIFMRAPVMSLQYCNALKGLIGGGVLIPFVIASPPAPGPAALMLALGALVSAPGLALAWYALARVHPTTTATIDLTEALMTPAAAATLFAVPLTTGQVLVMVPVLAAAALEIRRPHPPAPTAEPHDGDGAAYPALMTPAPA